MQNKTVSQFELRKKLQEALQSGKYFITVTYLNEDKKNLSHYFSWENFPVDDVIPSLSHIAMEIDGMKDAENNS